MLSNDTPACVFCLDTRIKKHRMAHDQRDCETQVLCCSCGASYNEAVEQIAKDTISDLELKNKTVETMMNPEYTERFLKLAKAASLIGIQHYDVGDDVCDGCGELAQVALAEKTFNFWCSGCKSQWAFCGPRKPTQEIRE